jgi:hypothetical protein
VIHEVDEALRRLIREEAARGGDLEVVFDAPTKDWASRRNAPTINAYLYDLREDTKRRTGNRLDEYVDGRLVARRRPPRYFKLSYLLSAWTQRTEDEHRLLSTLLSTLLRHDVVPQRLLTGRIAELGIEVPITVALPPPEDRSFADVWQALGGELKPSIDIVVSCPADVGLEYAAGPPAEAGVTVGMRAGDVVDTPVAHHVRPTPDGAPPSIGTRRVPPRRP